MVNILNRDDELKDYLFNIFPGMLDWTFGQAYLYGKDDSNADSALFYLLKARDPLYMNAVMIRKRNFITELAMAYNKIDKNKAIETYETLLGMEQQTENYSGMQKASNELKKLYAQLADYTQAFRFSTLYDEYTSKISEQAKDDELAQMTIENERKEKERNALEILQKRKQAFNLQYLFIAILIFSLFIGLAMMGLYKVSQRTVRLLGFFSFLLLFEFITLISKKWISNLTGGTPWQDFLFMILLALIMLPLHNWLEHQIIGYLVSKELLKPRKVHKNTVPVEAEPMANAEQEKQETPVRKITS
jgi:hypothetical protein